MPTYTTEQFKEKLQERYPGRWTVLGDYVNTKTKILARYNECGHEAMVVPAKMINGVGCPVCNSNLITSEEFAERVERLHPGKYTLMSDYVNYDTKMLVKYNECGCVSWVPPYSLTTGKDCIVHHKAKRRKTQEEFEKQFHEKNGDEYQVASKYTLANGKITLRHKCGYEYETIADKALQGTHPCPFCYPNECKIPTPYANDIYTLDPELYSMLKYPETDGHKYKPSSNVKVWLVCPRCGKEIYQSLNQVKEYGLNCPICGGASSFPEKVMAVLLDKLGVVYYKEYSPEWIAPKRYDFYLPDYSLIIEMDGAFHTNQHQYRGSDLGSVVEVDHYKDEMAEKHGIKVIRINADYRDIRKRFEYIMKNIKESELEQIFNISQIQISESDVEKDDTIFRVVEAWKNTHDFNKIAEELDVCSDTVRNYIMKAANNGLIQQSYEEIKAEHLDKLAHDAMIRNGTPVMCNQTGQIFPSMQAANRKYGIRVDQWLKGHIKTAGILPDGTKMTWKKIA